MLAVSGGGDSLALLHLMHGLRDPLGIVLHVATFDHGLRGDESWQDALFVRDLAQTWGLPVTVGRAAHVLKGEAAARDARYAFLATTARGLGAATLMTAHHADDQAETVLLHIVRGAGLRGLGGMRWKAPVPRHTDLTLVRPLLTTLRTDLWDYCLEHGLIPREDPTNADRTHTRNFLRHEVMPVLQTLNPRMTRALGHLAEQVAVDRDLIERVYAETVLPHLRSDAGHVWIPREPFNAWHAALQRRAIQRAVEQVAGGEHTQPHERITAAVNAARKGSVGAVIQFPGRVHVRVDYDAVHVERDDLPHVGLEGLLFPADWGDAAIAVACPGITQVPGAPWRLHSEQYAPAAPTGIALWLPLDADPVLRARRPGDTIVLAGMQGHRRSLKEWMIDEKIPKDIRARIPLLMIGDDVAAILYGERWLGSVNYLLGRADRHKYYFFANIGGFMSM